MKLQNLDKKLLFIVIISIVATFNAAYLTYMAYTVTAPTFFWSWLASAISTSYSCDINSTFSCSTVFSNDFSWIFTLPFSLYALFIYPIIIIVALLWLFRKIYNHYKIILAIAIWWIIFNWYIIVNEYLISAYCILCLICTVIIIINGWISIKWIKEAKNRKINEMTK